METRILKVNAKTEQRRTGLVKNGKTGCFKIDRYEYNSHIL